MKRPRSKEYDAFLTWFRKHRNDLDLPPYAELAVMFDVSKSTLYRWIRELGGLKHGGHERLVLSKIDYAKKYVEHANRVVPIGEVMRHVGYSDSCCTTYWYKKRFYNSLVQEGLGDKVDFYAQDRDSDRILLQYAETFYRRRSRSPNVKETAQFLGRRYAYARRRIEELMKTYPTSFRVVHGVDDERADEDLREKECVGSRERLREWQDWKKKNRPDAFGFEFKGEVWDRYLKMWDLRKKGLCWRMKLERPNAICIFEEGRVARLNSRGEVDDY